MGVITLTFIFKLLDLSSSFPPLFCRLLHTSSKDTKQKEVHYSTYLQLDKILTAQALRSEEVWGQPVHDEHFFILIHQGAAYVVCVLCAVRVSV